MIKNKGSGSARRRISILVAFKASVSESCGNSAALKRAKLLPTLQVNIQKAIYALNC